MQVECVFTHKVGDRVKSHYQDATGTVVALVPMPTNEYDDSGVDGWERAQGYPEDSTWYNLPYAIVLLDREYHPEFVEGNLVYAYDFRYMVDLDAAFTLIEIEVDHNEDESDA